jgi:hypothetical protein
LKYIAQRSAAIVALAALIVVLVFALQFLPNAAAQSKKDFDVSWNPPNSEAPLAYLAADEPCPGPEVVSRAGLRAAEIVDNLAKFDAVETTKRAVLDDAGFTLAGTEGSFDYTVEFLKSPGSFKINEARTPLPNSPSKSDSVQDSGLAAMVILLHPSFQSDFEFHCEGKVDWEGRESWVIHFAQLESKPSRILSLRTDHGVYRIPLKGRVWVTADAYQTQHIETNLAHPVQGLPMVVNAVSADYAPVHFKSTNRDLWLPQRVETYVHLSKQRNVTAHAYSQFQLFSVDSTNVISPPKIPDSQQPAPK